MALSVRLVLALGWLGLPSLLSAGTFGFSFSGKPSNIGSAPVSLEFSKKQNSGFLADDLVIHSSSLCPADGGCEMVCANSTVTYFVDNPDGLKVIWEVTGAVDFTVSGNEVVVLWGGEGNGSVNAKLVPTEFELQLDCGQAVHYDPAFPETGGAYISPWTVALPLEISLDEGATWELFNHQQHLFVGGLALGEHQYTVRDATGQTATCLFEMDAERRLEVWRRVIYPPTDCDSYDGKIVFSGSYSSMSYWSGGLIVDQSNLVYAVELLHLETGNVFTDTITLSLSGPTGGMSGLPGGHFVGTFTVQYGTEFLVVTKEFYLPCSDNTAQSASLCINILTPPTASISADPAPANQSLHLCKGESAHFTDESENASSVVWDFGDGFVSTLHEPVHSFREAGVYEIRPRGRFCGTARRQQSDLVGRQHSGRYNCFTNRHL